MILRLLTVTVILVCLAGCTGANDRAVTIPLTEVAIPTQIAIMDATATTVYTVACDVFFFEPSFDPAVNGWCVAYHADWTSAIIQPFERGIMLWLCCEPHVYLLQRDPSTAMGGTTFVYGIRSYDGGNIPAPRESYFLPDSHFLAYWDQINQDQSYPDFGWATAPAQSYTMQRQPIDQTGWTMMLLQWGPRFFMTWSFGNEVIAVGHRTWSIAGHVDMPPVAQNRPTTIPTRHQTQNEETTDTNQSYQEENP